MHNSLDKYEINAILIVYHIVVLSLTEDDS